MLSNFITAIIKAKDDESGIPVFQRLVAVLEEEYDDIVEYIDDLYGFLLVDISNPYKKYLLEIVGGSTFSDLDIWILKSVSYLHKLRGTSLSWNKYLNWLLNRSDVSEVELYKDAVYEDEDWDTFYNLKSSKVTFCESSCETSGETIDTDSAQEYFESVTEVLPIHVSLKTDVTKFIESDGIDFIEDTIGCTSCETICEVACENLAETNASQNYGYLSSDLDRVTDSITLTLRCIATCETSCENCCETACECDPCELYCESGCEAAQTHGTGAGAGAGCTTQCEVNCESDCELGCEWACEAGCQHGCESGCQGLCEENCQTQYCQFGVCQCAHEGGACNEYVMA